MLESLTHSSYFCFKVSIVDYNAPNVKYGADAVDCLTEAYKMYPNDHYERIAAFSQLYEYIHPESKWVVLEACDVHYNPEIRYFVNLNVTNNDDSSTYLTIFN